MFQLIMKTLETFSALVREHNAAWFAANYPGPFLIRRRDQAEMAAEPRYGTFLHLPTVKRPPTNASELENKLLPTTKEPPSSQEETSSSQENQAQSLSNFQLYLIAKTKKNSFTNGVTIGRTQNNDIVIPLSSISKFHAWIQLEESSGSFSAGKQSKDQFFVFDAKSRYGTFVDGARVNPDSEQGAPLQPEATIQIGDAFLTFLDAPALYQWLSHQMKITSE